MVPMAMTMTMMMTVASVIMVPVTMMAMSAVIVSAMTMASVVMSTMIVATMVMTSVVMAVTVIKSGRGGRSKGQGCSRDKGSEQKFHWGLGMFLRLLSFDYCSHILRRDPIFVIQAVSLFF